MAARKLVTGAMSAAVGGGLVVALSASPAAASSESSESAESAESAAASASPESSDEITAPSDNAQITKGSSVRIAADLGLAQSAKLRLRGPRDSRFYTVAEGWQEELTYDLDPSCPDYRGPCQGENPAPNGEYTVRVVDSGLLSSGRVEDEHSFTLRVPPQQPRQVSARAKDPEAVRLQWAAGGEPDLTAYDVLGASGARLERVSASEACAGGSCSTVVNVPSRTQDRRVSFAVRARRSITPEADRTIASDTSGTVAATVPAAPTPDPSASSGHGRAGESPSDEPARGATPAASRADAPQLRPLASSSRIPLSELPGRLEGKSGRGRDSSVPVIPGPTPSPHGTMGGVPPPALERPQGDGDPRSMTSAVSMAPSQWWKTVALGLVLLLVAAHLGAWTWRTRPEPPRIAPTKKRSAGSAAPGTPPARSGTYRGRAGPPGRAASTGGEESASTYRGRRRRG